MKYTMRRHGFYYKNNVEMLTDEVADELNRLDQLINSPHTVDFFESARLEVAHQVERWGTAHDVAKQPADWHWLMGYLAGKALQAHATGDLKKALHHTISSAAALANWHAAIAQIDNRFEPGNSTIQELADKTFKDTE